MRGFLRDNLHDILRTAPDPRAAEVVVMLRYSTSLGISRPKREVDEASMAAEVSSV